MAPSATFKMLLESAAYKRMRDENPSEFVPRSVFFTNDRDRGNSFWVKAALVYESITGVHVNDETKPAANSLLLSLAEKCCSLIPDKASDIPATSSSPPLRALPSKSAPSESPTPSPRGEAEGEKKTQLPYEGSEKNKQVIDGIFLVVGFLSRLREASRINGRDAVDESFKSTHMQNIVTDVIKLENQLPLKLLLEVVDHVEQAVNDTLSTEFKNLIIKKKYKNNKYELEFKRDNFHEVIHCFCWYYSPFFHEKAATQQIVDGDPKMEEHTLLDCLHASLVPRRPVGAGARGDTSGKTSSIPTARELTRSGVRFEAGEDGRAAVNFNERSSRLRLPALVYDFKLATVARNLLAREYEEQSKPVTRYFQMMNELVEEVADVRILRRARVVRGGSRGAHDVHELIKKIDGYATYPSVFMAMDQQIEKVKQFHDKRMKNFLVRYRPGVIWASSLAAVSVVAIVAARKKRA